MELAEERKLGVDRFVGTPELKCPDVDQAPDILKLAEA
jgi:hypothetical protein